MTTSRRHLRRFGATGLLVGAALVLCAPLVGSELAGLVRGYGAMLTGSAAYMLAGLWIVGLRQPRAGIARPSAASDALHRV